MSELPTEDDSSVDDSRALVAHEVRELRNAVQVMAQRTEALSRDFGKVNELTARQQEVDRRTAEAVAEAARAVATVRKIEQATVPRKEIDEREATVRTALVAYRRRVASRWMATTVIGIAVMLAAIMFAVNWASGYRGSIYTVCVQRDDQSAKVRHYLEDQKAGALARVKTQAERDAILRSIRQLEDAFPNVPCKGLQ